MSATATRRRKPKSKARLAEWRRIARAQHAEQRRMLDALPMRTDEQIQAGLERLRWLQGEREAAARFALWAMSDGERAQAGARLRAVDARLAEHRRAIGVEVGA